MTSLLEILLQYITTLCQYIIAQRALAPASWSPTSRLRSGTGGCSRASALPPVRTLAAELRLSPATVAAAYRDLRIKGIARGHRRAGTRITGAPPMAPRPPLVVPAGVRQLLAGSPDPGAAARVPGNDRRRPGPVSPRLYGDAAMHPRLAELAAARLRADGIDPRTWPSSAGRWTAWSACCGAWLRPGDRVAVEDPGYAPLLDLLAAMDLTAEPVALDESRRPAGRAGARRSRAAAAASCWCRGPRARRAPPGTPGGPRSWARCSPSTRTSW